MKSQTYSALHAQQRIKLALPGEVSTLTEDEVHLWVIPLSLDENQSAQAQQWLNPHQQDRYERRADDLKMTYLAGRYYMLKLLAAYSGISPPDIKLEYSRLNKPFLSPNPQDLAFNFSDSQNDPKQETPAMGVYAFTRGAAIGADIEPCSRQGNFKAVARRKFTAREQALVSKHDGTIDGESFLALWTRKEAYGKATGRGVNYRMNQLDLASPGQNLLSFNGLDSPDRYQLQQLKLGNDHIACVVYPSAKPRSLSVFSPAAALCLSD